MKKNKYAMTFSIVILLICGSCKKHEIKKEKEEQVQSEVINPEASLTSRERRFGVTVNNNMLVFSSVFAYAEAIENTTDDTEKEFLNTIASLPRYDLLSKDTASALYKEIDDTYFSSILNKDGCVQIGNNIYRVDPFKESVYVLRRQNLDSVSFSNLINGNQNPNILIYSTNDNVIQLVENNVSPIDAQFFCSQSGIAAQKKKGTVEFVNPRVRGYDNEDKGDFDARIRYIKLGIYFDLKLKARVFSVLRRIEIHKTPIYYKQRCGNTVGPNYSWNEVLGVGSPGNGGWFQEKCYSSMKGLNEVQFHVIFMAKYILDPNVPDPSIDLEIRVNC